MGLPNAKEIGAIQNLIDKKPLAFVAALFAILFGGLFFLHLRTKDDSSEYWKELYMQEKASKDLLKDQLLIKAGVIERQNEVIIKADSTLKDNVTEKINKLIENEIP